VTDERYVVLGLAPPHETWFREVARWATDGRVAMDFVKCLSPDELRARLGSGRLHSALLVDGRVVGLDRDLLDFARRNGTAPLVLESGRGTRDWYSLGAFTVLSRELSPEELLVALREHAEPVVEVARRVPPSSVEPAPGWRAPLITVLGAGGAGSSTIAMAIAQGAAADQRYAGRVVLLDFALDADQAFLHDVGDVVPGLPELVEAHRLGNPPRHEVDALLHELPDRGYRVLLGVRRHRDWAGLRPLAVDAALDALRAGHRLAVADVDRDLEGEDECGSIDIEERNHLSRIAVQHARVVVVVGSPNAKGLHALIRVLDGVLALDVDPSSVIPLINRSPRSPRIRSKISAAFGELTASSAGWRELPSPVHILDRRRLDEIVLSGAALPATLVRPAAGVVLSVLDRAAQPPRREPVAVGRGSLGSWSDVEVCS
jgi:hypothetical protein